MWIVGAGPRACPHRKGTAKTPSEEARQAPPLGDLKLET